MSIIILLLIVWSLLAEKKSSIYTDRVIETLIICFIIEEMLSIVTNNVKTIKIDKP